MAGCSEGGTAGPLVARALYSTLAHSTVTALESPTLAAFLTLILVLLARLAASPLAFFLTCPYNHALFVSFIAISFKLFYFKACYCVLSIAF